MNSDGASFAERLGRTPAPEIGEESLVRNGLRGVVFAGNGERGVVFAGFSGNAPGEGVSTVPDYFAAVDWQPENVSFRRIGFQQRVVAGMIKSTQLLCKMWIV